MRRTDGIRIARVDDGVAAVTGDRTDAAEGAVAVETMVGGVGMAEHLNGQKQGQQQGLQKIRFSIDSGHRKECKGFARVSPRFGRR